MTRHNRHNLNNTGFLNNSGFTLIEVLITVVILSIGLLGMAGIQIQGLRGTTSSTVRSQATILANDIAERIRMNAGGIAIDGAAQNKQYSNVNITTDAEGASSLPCGPSDDIVFCSATSATPTTSTIEACDTAQMTAFDIYEFACGLDHNSGVQNLLPNGSATISCNDVVNCPPGSELTINISWTENNTTDGAAQVKNISMVIIP